MNGSIFFKFPKFEPKLAQNLEKWGDFAQNLAQIGLVGIRMGCFFFKNWYLYGYTLKFRSGMSLPEPNFSTPRGPAS